jgi:hypothetical protein
LAFFFTEDFTRGRGLFWLYDTRGGGGRDFLGGDGDGDRDVAVPWNASSSSRASSSSSAL